MFCRILMKMTFKRYIGKLTIVLTFLITCLLYNWSSFVLDRTAVVSKSRSLIKEYPKFFGLRRPARMTALTSSVSREELLKSRKPCPDEPCNQSSIPKPASSRTDAVIVLTMMRSGSSIIGSLFNERSNVTYLYEPLYPFGERPCDLLPKDRVQVLRHISRCEFDKLPPLYTKAFSASHRPDTHSRCKIHNVCFTSKTGKVSHFLSRDAKMCRISKRGLQVCPEPLDSVALNKHCKQSLLVAMKIIYLCKLEWLVPLLEDPDYNIKVVHLVRDPRGTLNSRSGSRRNALVESARLDANLICEQLIPNVNFADDVLSKSKVKDKYLRVRYEDFASDPLGIAEKIYNFVGINMNTHVRQWLQDATSQTNNPNLRRFEQGLKRNPTSSMLAWRKELSLEVVQVVQERCSEALQKLGYNSFNNTEELRNLDKGRQTYF